MIRKIFPLIFCFFASFSCFAATIDSVMIYSNAMKKNVPCIVIKPSSYKKNKTGFPVVYLLHGYSGNQRQWIKDAPNVIAKADELSIILVCPDAGYGSWYFDSPIDSNIRYETFMHKELVPFIDSHYKTIADRGHRAITGLSMGGHGALYLSVRHSDLFGTAGSICGGVDFRPFPKNWDLAKDLGDTSCCIENWNKNVVVNVVDQLQNGKLKIIIDCGLGDFFLQVNRDLHEKLMRLKIDHDYIERPGAHNKDYWSNSIDYQLLYFKKYFEEKVMSR